MNELIHLNINLSKIDKQKIVVGEKGKYLNIVVAPRKEADKYGNTHTIYEALTQDEKERKKQGLTVTKNYLGNGRTYSYPTVYPDSENNDDLPF